MCSIGAHVLGISILTEYGYGGKNNNLVLFGTRTMLHIHMNKSGIV